MFNDSDKLRFKAEGIYDYSLGGGKQIKNRVNPSITTNKDTKKKTNHINSKTESKKGQFMFSSNPIREEKVRAAKIKKRRGDYNSEEVYRKIADRLMDLFGIK